MARIFLLYHVTNHRTNNVIKRVYENLLIHVVGRISYGFFEYASSRISLSKKYTAYIRFIFAEKVVGFSKTMYP